MNKWPNLKVQALATVLVSIRGVFLVFPRPDKEGGRGVYRDVTVRVDVSVSESSCPFQMSNRNCSINPGPSSNKKGTILLIPSHLNKLRHNGNIISWLILDLSW